MFIFACMLLTSLGGILLEHMNWGLYLFCRGERTRSVGDLSTFRGLHEPSGAAKEILQSRQRPSSPFARLTLADR